ncbi:MAG: polysaccharide deacetylase family protein [Gammaproteobacteria bacterium]
MLINKVKEKVFKRASSLYYVKPHILKADKPVVSFTFDDVPRSAINNGANVLKKYNVSGTFYLSGALSGKEFLGLEQFYPEDIETLLDTGQEIGCHTYDHCNCNEVATECFRRALDNNNFFFERYLADRDVTSFSYPYGSTSIETKKLIRARYSSGRGIQPGVNSGLVDLCELKANALYTNSMSEMIIDNLVEIAKSNNGWLIFYTHGVSENPNRFGCVPNLLEYAVKAVVDRDIEILNVKSALAHHSFN